MNLNTPADVQMSFSALASVVIVITRRTSAAVAILCGGVVCGGLENRVNEC